MKYRVRVDRMGRITIPKRIRKKVGIREGESIVELEPKVIEEKRDGVSIREEVIILRLLVR